MTLLVLVSGPPGAGKTTVARGLAPRLRLPLVAKDDIKERLSDSLGLTDLEWSKRLGAATWEILFVMLERFVADRASAIFESNFYPDVHAGRLLELHASHPFVPFEVHCTAQAATLDRRGEKRPRHRVHHSERTAEDWLHANGPLGLDENVIRVDTTTCERVDLDRIVKQIREVADGL